MARMLHSPWRDDPYRLCRKIREQGPLVRSRLGVLVATTYQLCDEALRDRRFGVRTSDGSYGDPTAAAVDLQLSLLELDPPDHSRLRKLAAPPGDLPRRIEPGDRARRVRRGPGFRQPVADPGDLRAARASGPGRGAAGAPADPPPALDNPRPSPPYQQPPTEPSPPPDP
ncbi:cytochrome P450 [Saccharopolyspora pogona]|uniref:cytochrome P450 n=1 Tax=Saccharopolyspora pogona TaxID=333966 RepID=UPI001CC22BB4|nr:cytochrome P450 [Saccharopolyspora pogona]